MILGSASTWAPGAAAGVAGWTLRAGDRLEPARRGDLDAVGRTWPAALAPHPASSSAPIRFVPGPDLDALPADAAQAFAAATWRAGLASDRMGIRLEGPGLGTGREILSHPLVSGAIQVPGDGQPVVLLADGPTVGGYPVVGVVSRAELPRIGQARPGDSLRFEPQDADEARAAWLEQRRRFDDATRAVRADAVWARLQENAGG
jgi:allophanate hydrolase subunit 2